MAMEWKAEVEEMAAVGRAAERVAPPCAQTWKPPCARSVCYPSSIQSSIRSEHRHSAARLPGMQRHLS